MGDPSFSDLESYTAWMSRAIRRAVGSFFYRRRLWDKIERVAEAHPQFRRQWP